MVGNPLATDRPTQDWDLIGELGPKRLAAGESQPFTGHNDLDGLQKGSTLRLMTVLSEHDLPLLDESIAVDLEPSVPAQVFDYIPMQC